MLASQLDVLLETPTRRVRGTREYITKSCSQHSKTLFGDRCKDACTVSEVVIRGLMADSCSSRYLAHRQSVGTLLGNECKARIEHFAFYVHGLSVQLDSV